MRLSTFTQYFNLLAIALVLVCSSVQAQEDTIDRNQTRISTESPQSAEPIPAVSSSNLNREQDDKQQKIMAIPDEVRSYIEQNNPTVTELRERFKIRDDVSNSYLLQQIHQHAYPEYTSKMFEDSVTSKLLRDQPEIETELLQKQPDLKSQYRQEALVIMNEQLRREFELLARAYREAEKQNNIFILIAGSVISLVFFSIGFWMGRRSGNRRLL